MLEIIYALPPSLPFSLSLSLAVSLAVFLSFFIIYIYIYIYIYIFLRLELVPPCEGVSRSVPSSYLFSVNGILFLQSQRLQIYFHLYMPISIYISIFHG